ncbi:MAG: PEP-CTERM sorting domain-containing protein [Rhodoferax sp.]
MKIKSLVIAAATVLIQTVASAGPSWIDWTAADTGTLTIGSTVVGVTLTGSTPVSVVNGTYYYDNAETGGISASGTYGGYQPSGMLQIAEPSFFTLTFSQAIENPFISLVSVGQSNVPVTYTFDSDVSVVSSGGNYWGYSGYSVAGNAFTGSEFNGVLQLQGSFTSMNIAIGQPEYWHGFNVGSASVSAVPEPETYAMMLAGLGLMGAIARRRKSKNA